MHYFTNGADMWIKSRLLPLLALISLSTAQATEPTLCLSCHGESSRIALGAPVLDAQHKPYLQKQLQQFKAGERGAEAADAAGQQMAAVAKNLSDAEIEQLAGYFAALPKAVAATEPAAASMLDKGRRIYIGNCGTCHGTQAEGNAALHAPALSSLNTAYLQLQLQHFRTGQRGQHKTDKPGRQMAMMARTLTEADVQAVVAYIGAGLP
ncbi:c-type cytochrome [Rheinheimera sp.]|uniref:c-type cytochrome n=1 Tax=Rheinheimera sp. TaxID=1869214 RepID=UPI00307D061E